MRLSEIRQRLAMLEMRPVKSLGQNFLHDQNLARFIAAAAVDGHQGLVVEIGPGLGAITEFLLTPGTRVLALERDARLASDLAARLHGCPVEVVPGDALDFDWRPLLAEGPVSLAGNLPYYATSPVLRHFLDPLGPVVRAVFTVQDEVARRLAAAPGEPDYGAMSVRLQRVWKISRLRKLPAAVFFPEPGVESAVVRLDRHPPRKFPPVDAAAFDALVQQGFSQRRKQLGKLLPMPRGDFAAWARAAGFSDTVRAEELPVAAWISLAQVLDPEGGSAAQDPQELFDEVDAEDRVLGPRTRGEIHARGLRHRAVHVLVFNHRGELFLQKRSAWKDREPLKWDSSTAGHVDAGEDYPAAARRETLEELGVELPLQWVGRIPACAATGEEFVEVFHARHEGPFACPPAEIDGGLFLPPALIGRWIERRPQDFAPGFLEVWRLVWATRADLLA